MSSCDVIVIGGVGRYQGRIVAANILGEPREANCDAVPRVTFTDPQPLAPGLQPCKAERTHPISASSSKGLVR